MEKVLLDTNILVELVKGHDRAKRVKAFIDTLNDPQMLISVVNVVEAESLVVQWKWGQEKVALLRKLMQRIITIDIEKSNQALMDAYVAIDAYSKRKTAGPSGLMLPQGAIRMGKNDLWLAATAHITKAILLTTDGDFDHLHDVFFTVQKF